MAFRKLALIRGRVNVRNMAKKGGVERRKARSFNPNFFFCCYESLPRSGNYFYDILEVASLMKAFTCEFERFLE
jgi:hypothetical protein